MSVASAVLPPLQPWGRWGTDVPHLGYGELAIALYASDLSSADPKGNELTRLADQGIERLGGLQQVRALYEWWTDLNIAREQRRITVSEYAAALRRRWEDQDLFERCKMLDYQRLPR